MFLDLEPERPVTEEDPLHRTDGGESHVEEGAEGLCEVLEGVRQQCEALQAKVASLQEAMTGEGERRINFMQVSEFDATLTEKEEEIVRLKQQLERTQSRSRSRSQSSSRNP